MDARDTLQAAYDAAMDDQAEGAVRWLSSYIEELTGIEPRHLACRDWASHGDLFRAECSERET